MQAEWHFVTLRIRHRLPRFVEVRYHQPHCVNERGGDVSFSVADGHVDLNGVKCVVVEIGRIVKRDTRRLPLQVSPPLGRVQCLAVAALVNVGHRADGADWPDRDGAGIKGVHVQDSRHVAEPSVAVVLHPLDCRVSVGFNQRVFVAVVDAQMRLEVCHADDAVEVWRACYFNGAHVAKIQKGCKPKPAPFP